MTPKAPRLNVMRQCQRCEPNEGPSVPRRTPYRTRRHQTGLDLCISTSAAVSGRLIRRRSRQTATRHPATIPARSPMKPSVSTLERRALLALVAPAKRDTSPLRGAWLETAAVYATPIALSLTAAVLLSASVAASPLADAARRAPRL